MPVSPVHAIVSGQPWLGVVTPAATPTAAHVGTVYVTGNAGSAIAETDHGRIGQLTIFLTGNNVTNPVIFSGAQFYLYLSKDGLSGTLSPGDIRYAGPFLTSDLTAPGCTGTLCAHVEANGTYYDGAISGLPNTCVAVCKVIEGPIPSEISSGYSFIKVWDGSSVAAVQYIVINPGITVSPSVVVANEPVNVKGGGFAASTLINLQATYVFHPWKGHKSVVTVWWEVGVSTTSNGYFSYNFPILDTAQSYNNKTILSGQNDVINISAWTDTSIPALLANIFPNPPAHVTEDSRILTYWDSYQYGGASVGSQCCGPYGNDSGAAPVFTTPIPVYAFGVLYVDGNYWTWGGTTNFYISNFATSGYFWDASAGNYASLGYPGSFYGYIPIPGNLTIGLHSLKIVSNGVSYIENITMEPTLILENVLTGQPSGTPSNPSTTVQYWAYGFPADVQVALWWSSENLGDNTVFNLAGMNATTNSLGNFVGQSSGFPVAGQGNLSLEFVVPESFGGNHSVYATYRLVGPFGPWDTASGPFPKYTYNVGCNEGVEDFCEENNPEGANGDGLGITVAQFMVTPSLVVLPYSSNNNGSTIMAVGEGFDPTVGYSVNIDNQQSDFSTISGAEHGLVYANSTGLLTLTWFAAGFQPGLHEISLTSADELLNNGSYAPAQHALFWITTVGEPVLQNITTQITGLSSMLTSVQSSLTNIQGTLSTMQTTLGTLATSADVTTAVSNLESYISGLNLATSSDVSNAVTTLSGDITTAKTAITTSVNGAVSSLETYISGLGLATTTNVNSAVTTLQGSITSAQNAIMSALTSATTGVAKASDVTSAVSNIESAITSATSPLAKSSDVTNAVTTIENAITSATSSLATHSDVSSAQTAITNAITAAQNSINSGTSTAQTYVLVVAVLAAITLVLELAILVRKLS